MTVKVLIHVNLTQKIVKILHLTRVYYILNIYSSHVGYLELVFIGADSSMIILTQISFIYKTQF